MNSFFARICWNETGWTRPDGSAYPHESPKNYVRQNGFGHEEWLFNPRHVIDGYHYGFVEAFNRTVMVEPGEKAHVILYSIGPKQGQRRRPRYIVGEIRDCEHLTEQQAEAALAHFREAGWLNGMADHTQEVISRLGLPNRVLRHLIDGPEKASHLITLRFRWKDTVRPGHPELVPPDHIIQSRDYYLLFKAGEELNAASTSVKRSGPAGTNQPLEVPKYNPRKDRIVLSSAGPESRHLHIKMQNRLLELWTTEFGDGVLLEDNYVDVKVDSSDRLIFCEVKARRPASLAIREALGQLLEYVFRDLRNEASIPELHVAGLTELNEEDRRYLNWLNDKFGLDINYHCVDMER